MALMRVNQLAECELVKSISADIEAATLPALLSDLRSIGIDMESFISRSAIGAVEQTVRIT